MESIGFGFINLVTEATIFSLGAWQAAFPASNMRTRDYSRPARSTNADVASSVFAMDNGSAITAQALVLDGHNVTAAGQVRWGRGTSEGGSEVATSGLLAAWPFIPKVYSGRDHQIIVVLPAEYAARWDYVEIQDSGNPAGTIEIARAGLYRLTTRTRKGLGRRNRLMDLSSKQRSPGGNLRIDEQRVLRGVDELLPFETLAEGDELHELIRVAGTTQEVLYLPSLYDRAHQQQYGFLGTLEQLDDVSYPYPHAQAFALRLTQAA